MKLSFNVISFSKFLQGVKTLLFTIKNVFQISRGLQMKKTIKLAASFLLATSSLAMADAVPVVINSGFRISDSQLSAFSNKISAQTPNTSTASATITPLSPATGITYYQVFAVASSNVPNGEGITASQTSTFYNHGGSEIDVVTLQYGYGNPNGATLAGTLGTHYLRELVCGPLSALYYCPVGEAATGFLDYFSFAGPQAGQYTSSASSVAYPYGYWSDSLYIQ